MSATGRGRPRMPGDLYETPGWCVRRLLEAVRLPEGLWVEPGCGRGRLMAAAAEVRPEVRWLGIEIDPGLAAEAAPGGAGWRVAVVDFLAELPPGVVDLAAHATVVIGNPPYSLAEAFLDRARTVAPNAWIVFLLRLAFIATESRHPLMSTSVPDMYVLPNRPSFVHGGTDATDYAWFLWQPQAMRAIYGPRRTGRHTVLALTPASERRSPARALPAAGAEPTMDERRPSS